MIELKMKRYGLSVSVNCTSSDDAYAVNTSGFLPVLEEFLQKLDDFENVEVEITTQKEDECYSLDSIDENEITITDSFPFPDSGNEHWVA